jgi:hypothetical protein
VLLFDNQFDHRVPISSRTQKDKKRRHVQPVNKQMQSRLQVLLVVVGAVGVALGSPGGAPQASHPERRHPGAGRRLAVHALGGAGRRQLLKWLLLFFNNFRIE